jgi:sigma-B regulation protein RsbU (phosphoserine phosphatase)
MRIFSLLPKQLRVGLMVAFAAATVLYSGLWIFAGSRGIPVELGFDNKYIPAERSELVKSVVPGSPAERAGMKTGDRIVQINGAPLKAEDSITRVWLQHKPGDTVDLTIRRPDVSAPILLHATFRASSSGTEAGLAQLGQDINTLFPLAFLTVGLIVLLLRSDDPNAWLLALMFAGFIAIPNFANSFLSVPSSLRPFAITYRAIFNNLVAAIFYFFFATFPAQSPLDRRLPWLKWLAVAVGTTFGIAGMLWTDPDQAAVAGWLSAGSGRVFRLCFTYGLIVLGFASLIWNAISVTSPEAGRKIRVILWGTLVGVVPATLVLAASDFFGFHITLWLGASIIVLLWIFPLSFAYAVVKHRVLEIPVLLRRGARYLLVQRGFVLLLVVLSVGVTLAFALLFAQFLQPLTGAAVPGGIALGTLFGTVLFWSGARVHHDVGRRIDRAFFRSAYDARMILQDLVEKTRTATDRKSLAALLEHHLSVALQPSSLVVYVETSDGRLSAITGDLTPESNTILASEPFLLEVAQNGQPSEFPHNADTQAPMALARLQPECLVPILGRESKLLGLVVLGMRLSEEPYSTEDKHLLAAVASQAGIALESIRLAENIAKRLEAERRSAQELEFARQVQTRLLPQKLPAMKTLQYTGACIPARTVGGDYYDFLELRPGRLGMVLADIAGKGVPGALLMANLQANLRSQYAMAIDDLPRVLASVNRLFYQSTDPASYATLFFADYDDATGLLRYANCGHLPPLLVRAAANPLHQHSGKSSAHWLAPTSTVLGLFEEWQCQIAEVTLAAGDTLVLYTDGITEATGDDEEEFGEERLLESVANQNQLAPVELLDALVTSVRQFSRGEQQDDITLVVARCAS